MVLVVNNLSASAGGVEMQVRSLVWEDSWEEDMATHSNIVAWRIPCTEEPGRLQYIRWQRVRRDQNDLAQKDECHVLRYVLDPEEKIIA